MVKSLIICNLNSVYEALGYRDMLINDGLLMDKDFVWKYHRPTDIDYKAKVEFVFTDEKNYTFYKLKLL